MAVAATFNVISPVLVGRAPALLALDTLIEQALAGRGQAVLVSGEAGIGKSRLVTEAVARFQERGAAVGALVVQGRCVETDRVFPWAPFIDLLRRVVRARPAADVADLLGPTAHEALALLPEAPRPPTDAAQPRDPEHEKRRLFEALHGCFSFLAQRAPLLIIVEDLHWADDTSLEFLVHLARRIPALPALLVLTYRDDEPHPALRHNLALLDRERLAREFALSRLNEHEVDLMLRAIFDQPQPVHSGFLTALHALTGGNPFFVEEILKSLVSEGDIYFAGSAWDRRALDELRIPRSVEDAVERRVARLGAAARQTLVLVAVAGQRFDFAVVQQLAGRTEDELVSAFKELIGAQLVVEESAERFAFRHALTRQAIYTGLLERERKALHGRVVQALLALHGESSDAYVTELAYHTCEAGDWERALTYARRAAERARGMYTPRAEVEHLNRALEAVERLAAPVPLDLLHRRGVAHEQLGNLQHARRDYEIALDLAVTAGDRRAEWQVLLDLGMLWSARDYDRAGAHYARAMDVARALGDRSAVGHSLNYLGNWLANVERPHEALDLHREALSIFEQLDDPSGVAATLDFLAVATEHSGDRLGAIAVFERDPVAA